MNHQFSAMNSDVPAQNPAIKGTKLDLRVNRVRENVFSLAQWLIQRLTCEEKIKVFQRRDRNGNMRWLIQDVNSNLWVFLDSEEEARAWLETRYYR